MHVPLLTTASLALILASAAASPITSTSTPASGTSFDDNTPPKHHVVAGLQGTIGVAGLAAGVGAAVAGCCCCRAKQQERKKRYQMNQDEMVAAEGDEVAKGTGEDQEGVREVVAGAEDGFRYEGGERVMEIPDTPPPSYAGLARVEEGIELEARAPRKG